MLKAPLYHCIPYTFSLLLLATGAASAQERGVIELAGGYQYLFDLPAEESVPQGFFVSAGWNATPWLALVGEFSASKKSRADGSSSLDFNVYGTMGGVRLRAGGFFGQVLVGQFALQIDQTSSAGRLEQTFTDTAIQPGVGFDIGLGRRVSARIQFDYRQILSDENDYGRELRVAAGVAVGIGGR